METTMAPKKRKVWAWADAHIGREIDGRDGGDWARLSYADMKRNVPGVDYGLVLGDVSNRAAEEEFEQYAKLRASSGVVPWFEIVGNHDHRGLGTGLYQQYVRPEERYVVLDGSLAWIMVSAERGSARGLLKPRTQTWLKKVLAKHADKNIIICSHQLVANTLRRTESKPTSWRILFPRPFVTKLRRERRIDAWLGGHEHGPPRDGTMAKRCGRTTFINVASLSHVYGTEACHSFVLEMSAGSRTIKARCRDHEQQRFINKFSITIPLPYPLKFDTPTIVDIHQ
jgi:predicted MPP superfamily phosphohydrolase